MSVVLGEKEFFKGIEKVKFEGQGSDNPLAYRWYDETKVVAGKPMKEWLRFAVAYWHSFVGNGADPFGEPTLIYPWNNNADAVGRAKVDFTNDVHDNEKRLAALTAYLKQKQEASGVKLLWGTANVFSNKRYMNGASTNPDFHVLSHAATQVKGALDATIALGGENYVFWGGREGYMSLLNTNMKREKEHLAKFLHTAKDYARKKGFKGTFFIEPKPCEPTKHQYDYDSETVIGFLRQYDLLNDFKLNIEVNHATLAGHTFQHELQVAADAGMLGSMDANRGDYQNGWDTDQFPTNINELVESMLIIVEAGGFQGGGINFDAKRRRNSTDAADLFHAHIGGIDTFARALITADAILQKSEYKKIRANRYASFDSGMGKEFEQGKLSLEDLRKFAIENGEPASISGQQELIENIINRYI
jgi:xylose isomerase